MDNTTVSVIIPVYNTKEYLKRCISSVCNQSYKDLEIIVVDDGSADGSGAVCDKLAARDARIKVMHKKNAGVAAARNDGIKAAHGSRLMFVDSDDWLPRRAVELLYERMTAEKADLVCGNANSMNSIRCTRKGIFADNAFDTTERDKFYNYLIPHIGAYTSWGNMYRTCIIADNGMFFPEDMPIDEDLTFVYTYIAACKRIATISEFVYFYNRINFGSITKTSVWNRYDYALRALTKRRELYGGTIPPEHKYKEDDLVLFVFPYSFFVRMLSKPDAIGQIADAYEKFRNLLDEIDLEPGLKAGNKKFIDFAACKDMLDSGDYDGVYEYLKKQPVDQHRTKKSLPKRMIIAVRKFLIFRLGLFYK